MQEVLNGNGGDGGVRVETVQSTVLCALWDCGAGEVERAWVLSGSSPLSSSFPTPSFFPLIITPLPIAIVALSLTLSLSLSLHLSTPPTPSSPLPLPDPDSLRLKTFHSSLILHTLLSLRLSRAPLVVLEDYDVPIPPDDGSENFELWRSDKTVGELREEWGGEEDGGAGSAGTKEGGGSVGAGGGGVSGAVRSSSLSTFARTASLCAIGLDILRWSVCPRRGNGRGLEAGEAERVELVARLQGWEEELALELRLGDGGVGAVGSVERLRERARWTVEMHMLAAALYLKLKPHECGVFSSPLHFLLCWNTY